VGVRLSGSLVPIFRVAFDADLVAGDRTELVELVRAVLGVGVMAGGAAHLGRAGAEQEIPCLARVDRAPAGAVRAEPALPGVRIAREEHRMAAGAGVVDPLGLPRWPAPPRVRGRDREQRRFELVGGMSRRIRHVLLAPVMAGLAADPHLDEVLLSEAPP